MEELERMPPQLIPPFLVAALGTVTGILWLVTRRANPSLIFTTAGFYLIALGLALHVLVIQYDENIAVVGSNVLYGIGAASLTYGLIKRSHQPGGVAMLAVMCIAIAFGTVWFAYISKSSAGQTYVINIGFSALLLFGAWRTRQLARGNTGDQLLFWWFLAVGIHYIPRAYLMASNVSEADTLSNGTFLSVIQLFPMAGLILLFGVITIIATGLDIINAIQDERDTDALTRVHNRRGLERLLRTTDWASRLPVSVLICDIDHFKQVNDRYGHAGGDQILEHFAGSLMANVRPNDVVARLGGEEFVVIMPATELSGGVAVAERIRSSNARMGDDSIAPGYIVQCSIGVAELQIDEDLWSAIRRADELLYQAKQQGRNRVVSSAGLSNLIKFPETALKKA